jgi:hypothetical protein
MNLFNKVILGYRIINANILDCRIANSTGRAGRVRIHKRIRIQEIIVNIIAISIVLFAGFLIGKSCESYCVTCNGYNFLFETSVLGLILLIFGLWFINKLTGKYKYKKRLYVLLFLYGFYCSLLEHI